MQKHTNGTEHPLSSFFKRLRATCIDNKDYQRRRRFLAESLGISEVTFYHLVNPKQNSNLEVRKAFMLELLTGGDVPCQSVSPAAKEALELAEKVLDLRDKATEL